MVAARVLAYGKEYVFEYRGEEEKVDLSTIDNKEVHKTIKNAGRKNEFEFDLPNTGNKITFRLLDHKLEKAIDREIEGLQKINKEASPVSTTRFKHMITSVNGLTEQKDIREFVDNYLLAQDARALREYYSEISPDVNLEVQLDGKEDVVTLPITLNFFWPDARI